MMQTINEQEELNYRGIELLFFHSSLHNVRGATRAIKVDKKLVVINGTVSPIHSYHVISRKKPFFIIFNDVVTNQVRNSDLDKVISSRRRWTKAKKVSA